MQRRKSCQRLLAGRTLKRDSKKGLIKVPFPIIWKPGSVFKLLRFNLYDVIVLQGDICAIKNLDCEHFINTILNNLASQDRAILKSDNFFSFLSRSCQYHEQQGG